MNFPVRLGLWLLQASLTGAASIITQPAETNLTFPSLTEFNATSGHNRISFQETVFAAVSQTMIRYPRAVLYEIEATSSTGATTNPTRLNDVRLIFGIPDQGSNPTLIVEMSHLWDVWLQPRLSPLPVPLMERPMPAWVEMDIGVANTKKKNAGFTGRYWSALVCWPVGLPLGKEQPMYMFQMEDTTQGKPEIIVVGTKDGSVYAIHDPLQINQPWSGRVVAVS